MVWFLVATMKKKKKKLKPLITKDNRYDVNVDIDEGKSKLDSWFANHAARQNFSFPRSSFLPSFLSLSFAILSSLLIRACGVDGTPQANNGCCYASYSQTPSRHDLLSHTLHQYNTN